MLLLNDNVVAVTRFPDKTSQVWKIPNDHFRHQNVVTWKFESEDEFMHFRYTDGHELTGVHPECQLRNVFIDGNLMIDESLSQIRDRIRGVAEVEVESQREPA